MVRQQKHNSVNQLISCMMIFFLLQTFLALSIVVPSTHAQNTSEFGTNILVNDGTSPYSNQVEPTLSILSTGRILVGWKEAYTHNGPGRRVGFAYSTDNGRTFSRNILMDPVTSGNYQSDPWLISDQKDVTYFVWIEFNDISESTNPELIGVARTTNGGISWDPPVNAENTPYFDDKETACIDSNGTIYIVWDHLKTDNLGNIIEWDLRFTKSVNGTTPFTPTKELELQPFIPYIHCSPNDTLYITSVNATSPESEQFEFIYFTRSIDLGETWSTPVLVSTVYPEVDLITVLDTDSEEAVYLAYSAGPPNSRNIYIIKSINGGITWNTPVKVNDDIQSSNYLRMVEMYIGINDTIHVAWLDTRLGEYNIYYSYSEDGGATFSPDEKISEVGFSFSFERPGDYFCMRQDPVSGDMCIVWTDGRSGEDHDIYFARQGLNIPPLPPKWPILVGFSVFIILVIIVLSILVVRKRS